MSIGNVLLLVYLLSLRATSISRGLLGSIDKGIIMRGWTEAPGARTLTHLAIGAPSGKESLYLRRNQVFELRRKCGY